MRAATTCFTLVLVPSRSEEPYCNEIAGNPKIRKAAVRSAILNHLAILPGRDFPLGSGFHWNLDDPSQSFADRKPLRMQCRSQGMQSFEQCAGGRVEEFVVD